MSKRILSEIEIRSIEKNTNVEKVSCKSITYSKEFKIHAVEAFLDGKSPTQIFLEAGFNLELIGQKQPSRCLRRWKNTYNKYGKEGLLVDNRGKAASGRPNTKELTDKQKLEKAEKKIKYLEAELEFIKKLEEMERQAMKKK